VARVTVMAMAQGLARGRHVSWNVVVAAAAKPDPFQVEDALFSRRWQQGVLTTDYRSRSRQRVPRGM
jgi:hypothetical protein